MYKLSCHVHRLIQFVHRVKDAEILSPDGPRNEAEEALMHALHAIIDTVEIIKEEEDMDCQCFCE